MSENNQEKKFAPESSLTAPADRVRDAKWKPQGGEKPLSNKETEAAVTELSDHSYAENFRRVERRYADPVDPLQRFGLFSFIPAKGSTPNKNGVYGFAKMRGSFSTNIEADEKAEDILRNVDSYHRIYHTYVGRPFPCCTTSDFSSETREIDIRKDMKDSVSASIRKQKKSDQREIAEVNEREKMLKETVVRDEDDQDPLEWYTTLNVKRAQVSWTYLETLKKLQEMKTTILDTRKQIDEIDEKSPEYREKYFERYCKARDECGLDNSPDQNTFLKFMVVSPVDELGF